RQLYPPVHRSVLGDQRTRVSLTTIHRLCCSIPRRKNNSTTARIAGARSTMPMKMKVNMTWLAPPLVPHSILVTPNKTITHPSPRTVTAPNKYDRFREKTDGGIN